jgi:hypothetical protein
VIAFENWLSSKTEFRKRSQGVDQNFRRIVLLQPFQNKHFPVGEFPSRFSTFILERLSCLSSHRGTSFFGRQIKNVPSTKKIEVQGQSPSSPQLDDKEDVHIQNTLRWKISLCFKPNLVGSRGEAQPGAAGCCQDQSRAWGRVFFWTKGCTKSATGTVLHFQYIILK